MRRVFIRVALLAVSMATACAAPIDDENAATGELVGEFGSEPDREVLFEVVSARWTTSTNRLTVTLSALANADVTVSPYMISGSEPASVANYVANYGIPLIQTLRLPSSGVTAFPSVPLTRNLPRTFVLTLTPAQANTLMTGHLFLFSGSIRDPFLENNTALFTIGRSYGLTANATFSQPIGGLNNAHSVNLRFVNNGHARSESCSGTYRLPNRDGTSTDRPIIVPALDATRSAAVTIDFNPPNGDVWAEIWLYCPGDQPTIHRRFSHQ